jgi:predicted nuclease of restriction endonuclease-like (RecB) superfamily
MKFELLVTSIEKTHIGLKQYAVKAVNVSLTLRNWLIGYYIVEFEQNGDDRAKYGDMLFKKLSEKLNIRGLGETNLKISRQFYTTYPQFHELLLPNNNISFLSEIRQLLPDEFRIANKQAVTIRQSATDELGKSLQNKITIDENFHETNTTYFLTLIQQASFTHFAELLKIADVNKRRFFELLIIKTTPSVKELQRQINTLSFERVGLSENTEIAYNQLLSKIEPEKATDAIKSIFCFDFLGLKPEGLLEEKELETALLNHLQGFIIELGNGFCFEARQKRILIDDEYFFIDLVFYHRILKCHILLELKIDKFKHEHLSQLNSYVSYFREEVKRPDDNDPIGILLCTEKGKKIVEYALNGMDEQLFVSKYLLELPDKKQLAQFVEQELLKWSNSTTN